MEFLATGYGKQICSLALQALRQYTQEVKQYAVGGPLIATEKILEDEFRKGARYVDKIIDRENGYVTIIFQKQ